jgi:hypothetical protein
MPEELYGIGAGVNLTAAQSVQTQNCVDVTIGGNSTSAGAGYVLISSGTVTLAGASNITLSQNGNAISFVGRGFSAGVSSGGNTAGTTGTVGNGLLFIGGTNITLSQSSAAGGATVTIDGPNIPLPPTPFSAGVSTGGNTAGNTGVVTTEVVFAGGNNITLSQSTAGAGITITISGPSFADQEAPTGTLNGTNTTFNLAHAPTPVAGLQLFVNGQALLSSYDYTISSVSLTMATALASDDLFRAWYRY